MVDHLDADAGVLVASAGQAVEVRGVPWPGVDGELVDAERPHLPRRSLSLPALTPEELLEVVQDGALHILHRWRRHQPGDAVEVVRVPGRERGQAQGVLDRKEQLGPADPDDEGRDVPVVLLEAAVAREVRPRGSGAHAIDEHVQAAALPEGDRAELAEPRHVALRQQCDETAGERRRLGDGAGAMDWLQAIHIWQQSMTVASILF